MPTPLEILLDPVSLAVIGIYASLMAVEALFPARPLPAVSGWHLRGIAAFLAYMMLSSYLPLLWSEPLARLQVLDLTDLGTWGGAIAGFFVYEAGTYLYHRSMHASTLLWRGLHQMHHSAERLDTYGAFWFSPLDMVGWTALASLALTLVGINPRATTLVLYAVTFLGVFQHTNIRTPRWLGYLIQRPESHSRHHARGVHAGNYADLPLFDLLFGTFHNPRDFVVEQGFYDGASARVPAMLAFKDVSAPPRAPGVKKRTGRWQSRLGCNDGHGAPPERCRRQAADFAEARSCPMNGGGNAQSTAVKKGSAYRHLPSRTSI